ncbi:MAG: hypothetical protein R6V02_06865 [Candidatus Aminicenantes bacterium]
MTGRSNDHKDVQDDYRIDYENIDVDDIMRQIRAAAGSGGGEEKKSAAAGEPEEVSAPPLNDMAALPGQEEDPGPPPPGRLQSVLLKILRPFGPLIKLMILPVHRQVVEALYHIDRTNRRIDRFDQNVSRELLKISGAVTQLDKRVDRFEQNLDKTFRELGRLFAETDRIKEYTKLIHALEHNLVVELTKLKIEADSLKVQTRIVEKDFALLKKRERVLENKVFE